MSYTKAFNVSVFATYGAIILSSCPASAQKPTEDQSFQQQNSTVEAEVKQRLDKIYQEQDAVDEMAWNDPEISKLPTRRWENQGRGPQDH